MMKKKTKIAIVLASVMALLLVGCGGLKFTYAFTTAGANSKIEVNDAKDGDTGEGGTFSVGKGKTAMVESSLDKGKLRIDFTQVTVFTHDKEPDDIIYGDVFASVTVGPGAKEEVPLDRGSYVLQVTAVGNTNGTVTVNVK